MNKNFEKPTPVKAQKDIHEIEIHEHIVLWSLFKERVKYQTRFHDDISREMLDEIFKDLEVFKHEDGSSPISCLNKDETIYRARIASDPENFHDIMRNPETELYVPPVSTKNGRMNAPGISVFYGGFSEDVCIAELKPSVGSSVVIGAFKTTRPIKVLDLTLFDNLDFVKQDDSKSIEYNARLSFLKTLHEEITMPAQPIDSPLEYIPTQIVADYLSNKLRVEGIVYSSSQLVGGRNVALFNGRSLIESSNAEGPCPLCECGEDSMGMYVIDKMLGKRADGIKKLKSRLFTMDASAALLYVAGSAHAVRIQKVNYETIRHTV